MPDQLGALKKRTCVSHVGNFFRYYSECFAIQTELLKASFTWDGLNLNVIRY